MTWAAQVTVIVTSKPHVICIMQTLDMIRRMTSFYCFSDTPRWEKSVSFSFEPRADWVSPRSQANIIDFRLLAVQYTVALPAARSASSQRRNVRQVYCSRPGPGLPGQAPLLVSCLRFPPIEATKPEVPRQALAGPYVVCRPS